MAFRHHHRNEQRAAPGISLAAAVSLGLLSASLLLIGIVVATPLARMPWGQ